MGVPLCSGHLITRLRSFVTVVDLQVRWVQTALTHETSLIVVSALTHSIGVMLFPSHLTRHFNPRDTERMTFVQRATLTLARWAAQLDQPHYVICVARSCPFAGISLVMDIIPIILNGSLADQLPRQPLQRPNFRDCTNSSTRKAPTNMQLHPKGELIRCLAVAIAASVTTLLWHPRLHVSAPGSTTSNQREIIIVDESGRPCIRLSGQSGNGTIAFFQDGGPETRLIIGQGLPSASGDSVTSDACGIVARPSATRAGFTLLSAPNFGVLELLRNVDGEAAAFTAILHDGVVNVKLLASEGTGGSLLDLRTSVSAAELDMRNGGRGLGLRVNPLTSQFDTEFSIDESVYSAVLGCDEFGPGLSLIERLSSEVRKRRVAITE